MVVVSDSFARTLSGNFGAMESHPALVWAEFSPQVGADTAILSGQGQINRAPDFATVAAVDGSAAHVELLNSGSAFSFASTVGIIDTGAVDIDIVGTFISNYHNIDDIYSPDNSIYMRVEGANDYAVVAVGSNVIGYTMVSGVLNIYPLGSSGLSSGSPISLTLRIVCTGDSAEVFLNGVSKGTFSLDGLIGDQHGFSVYSTKTLITSLCDNITMEGDIDTTGGGGSGGTVFNVNAAGQISPSSTLKLNSTRQRAFGSVI